MLTIGLIRSRGMTAIPRIHTETMLSLPNCDSQMGGRLDAPSIEQNLRKQKYLFGLVIVVTLQRSPGSIDRGLFE